MWLEMSLGEHEVIKLAGETGCCGGDAAVTFVGILQGKARHGSLRDVLGE